MAKEEYEYKIIDKMKEYSEGNSVLLKYLTMSIGRIMRKEALHNDDWEKVFPHGSLIHIRDWLWSSIKNQETWLKNVDEKDRPKKLMKFSTMQNILQEADKAMMKTNQKIEKTPITEGQEEIFYELENGYTVVRMLTPEALDRESSYMQHCIGQGSYDDKVIKNDYIYLSLRDQFGKPHVTIELVSNYNLLNSYDYLVEQFQGKQNKLPNQKYMDILLPFIKSTNYDWKEIEGAMRIIKDVDGVWHDITNLPNGFTYGNNLEIKYQEVDKLPDNMKINGGLTLTNLAISDFPKKLIANEINLNSLKNKIHIPDLDAGHLLLNVFNCNEITLNENIKLGALFVYNTKLQEIPKGVTIDDLHLTDTGNTTISEDITCNQLYLGGSKDFVFSNSNYSIKSIEVKDSSVEFLDSFNSSGNIRICNTKIKKMPSYINVVEFGVEKSIIEEFNQNLTVDGFITFKQINDCAFPEKITCTDEIIIRNCHVALPKEIVADYITLDNAMSKQYPDVLHANKKIVLLNPSNKIEKQKNMDIKAQKIVFDMDPMVDMSKYIDSEIQVIFASNQFNESRPMSVEKYEDIRKRHQRNKNDHNDYDEDVYKDLKAFL